METKLMERVAIYARISTDNFGQDVDRQLHEVRDYCQRMGYEIVEEYVDEGFARTTRNRPALDKLIKDARQRKFHLVISDELSRFAGTPNLLLNLLEELKLWNVHLVSVKEGISNSRRKNDGAWGRRTNLTDEVAAQILERRNEGWGIKKLAKEFSVSNQTVRKVLPEFAAATTHSPQVI